jgi:oxazoline/thiazoline synthase
VKLMGYSPRQYAERGQWNRHGEMCSWVPEPFDPTQAIEWSPAWSLTERRRRYVPTAFCYYGYPFHEGPVFTRADSNGCAAGNTRTEAVLQGLLELVERDAVALWWYNRLRMPGVDLASFGDPYLLDTALHWRARGRELWALDLTSDLGIPTFAAISRQVEGPFPAIVFGFGAHVDAKLALLRAVTEHNQLMPFAFTGAADKPSPGGLIVDWMRQATVESVPYLLPNGTAPRTPRDFAPPAGGDLRETVDHCVGLARGRGLETLVLDQTRPDTDLVVVKVIVPGLRHFWARLGPGRLYDVPVAMGRLEAPLPEEAMNPHPMFV